VQNEFDDGIATYRLLSKELTLVSLQDNVTWPYFVAPYFGLQAQSSRSISAGYIHAICPIIYGSSDDIHQRKKQWEVFSNNLTASSWIFEDQYQPVKTLGQGAGFYSHGHTDVQRRMLQTTSSGGGVFFPISNPNTTTTTNETFANEYSRTPTIPSTTNSNGTSSSADTANTTTNTTTTTTSTTNESSSFLFAVKDGNSSIFSTITRFTNEKDGGDRDKHVNLIQQNDLNPYYAPVWQTSPVLLNLINHDILSISEINASFTEVINNFDKHNSMHTIISSVLYPYSDPANESSIINIPHAAFLSPILRHFHEEDDGDNENHDGDDENQDGDDEHHDGDDEHHDHSHKDDIVGLLVSIIPLDSFFSNLYRSETTHATVTLVLIDPSNTMYTYSVDGSNVQLLGKGDLHDPYYNTFERKYAIRTDHQGNSIRDSNGATATTMTPTSSVTQTYTILLYPTKETQAKFQTNSPLIFAGSIVGIFCFTAFIFAVYNMVIQRRQNKVMSSLEITSKVVLSLFPANVLDRLIKEAEATTNDLDKNDKTTNISGADRFKAAFAGRTERSKIQSFLGDNNADNNHVNLQHHSIFKSKPIADLYPNATVMYADIAGFTAWSSIREPCQVFTLLEALFRQYDILAKRRRIFKVETIGDCYVAVAGVPHPRSDHAMAMARFARDCILSMNVLCKKLEIELGPDTSGT
jgi:Adenylate and Guanylate cyclase catalytic domain